MQSQSANPTTAGVLPAIKLNYFPWDIFSPAVYENFKSISHNANIPLDYLGVQALFSVAALAGNQYVADVNGGVKPILFIAKIGPSGIGKTPAFHKLLGDVIRPLRIKYADECEFATRAYKQRQRDAQRAKMDFDEEPPAKRVRVIEGGTVEALAKHSISSPAGFGVVYDEGERMFDEINKYNNGGNSFAFWNEAFGGKTIETVRVDADRERFVRNPAISLDIGLQTDRLQKYFTEDAVASGILNRFLIVESGHIKLNEQVDLFSRGAEICDDWADLIKYLFTRGIKFAYEDTVRVPFDAGAQQLLNHFSRAMIAKSNVVISSIREGDATKYISNYRSKLYNYFTRLALVLAIMRRPKDPIITQHEIMDARALCDYFEHTANRILRRLFESTNSGLTENEQRLLDALPASFTNAVGTSTAERLGFSASFFNNCFRKKLSKGFVSKTGRGQYEKNEA